MNSLPECLKPWLPLSQFLAQLEAGEVPERTSVHHDPLTGAYRVLFYQHKLAKKIKYLKRSVVLHDPSFRFARALLDGRDQLLQLELHPFVAGDIQEQWLELLMPEAKEYAFEPLP